MGEKEIAMTNTSTKVLKSPTNIKLNLSEIDGLLSRRSLVRVQPGSPSQTRININEIAVLGTGLLKASFCLFTLIYTFLYGLSGGEMGESLLLVLSLSFLNLSAGFLKILASQASVSQSGFTSTSQGEFWEGLEAAG
jgi:hypothetical protein